MSDWCDREKLPHFGYFWVLSACWDLMQGTQLWFGVLFSGDSETQASLRNCHVWRVI